MTSSRLLLAACLATAVACSEDGRTAEGAQILVPDSVSVEWDSRLNAANDGLGILVPVDVMVYEGATGEPLELVRIDVNAGSGATVLDLDSVQVLGSDCTDCVWDAGRDRYVLLPSSRESSPLLTDPDGLARIYLWIDAFPTDDDDVMLPVHVDVDTEVSGSTFEIHGT